MFDQLFKHASTRARHVTAPFAEERARYLDYCELRGDSRSLQLRKAHDLLWIASKLNSRTELQVASDQIRALVVNCQHYGDTGGPNLNLLSTRKRLLGHACAWFRYLGYLCEPTVEIPFGSRLLEYCDWAKQQRGLTDSSIYYFRGTIRRFLRWYGPIGRQLCSVHASDIDAYIAFGSGRGWARVTIHNVVAALRGFFRYGAQEGWCPRHLAETIQGPRIYAQEGLPAGPTWVDVERAFCGIGCESVHRRA
jgi:integrase/recombinase XerD